MDAVCDLAALPRLPGADGWSDVSVEAVADHLCAIFGLPQPDTRLLVRCLGAWRGDGIGGSTPRAVRSSGRKSVRSKPQRAEEWRAIAILVGRLSESGAHRRAPSIPAGRAC